MLNDGETLADLQARFPRSGVVTWIGVRPRPREGMRSVDAVRALADKGLDGDHRARRGGGRRQVTLIQAEHLEVVGRLLNSNPPDPTLLRRNFVVSGINLIALKGQRFRLGDALLEGTVPCHPCSRMEQNLGDGGYNAMRGHGGLCAVVIEGGELSVGAALRAAP